MTSRFTPTPSAHHAETIEAWLCKHLDAAGPAILTLDSPSSDLGPDAGWDAIVANGRSIGDAAEFRHITRKLKPGGLLIASFENPSHISAICDLLAPALSDPAQCGPRPTREEWRTWVSENNLTLREEIAQETAVPDDQKLLMEQLCMQHSSELYELYRTFAWTICAEKPRAAQEEFCHASR